MKYKRNPIQSVEMQMGPMIDMVFLLLVFFLVNARPVPQETEIPMSLPGTVSQTEPVDVPEELKIVIANSGQVFLNDLALDGLNSREMPVLWATLTRIHQAAVANRSQPLVTLDVADDVHYQRIIDVLNTCTQAQISSVSFTQAEEEY